MKSPLRFVCVIGLLGLLQSLSTGLPGQTTAGDLQEMVENYLWPDTDEDFARAQAMVESYGEGGLSRMQMHDLAEMMRRGRPEYPVTEAVDGRFPLQEFAVELPGGAVIPVLVQLPSGYSTETSWPLMFAMHGGPPGSAQGVRRSAARMVSVWVAAAERVGWIVAAPGMSTTASAGGRTQDRLPYEIFHQEEAKATVDYLRERFNINPNRIVSTGISLGSNFSIGYAAAYPDWLSAIVPVSTEGDSRELILRNLKSVPAYVLEGSQDRNIRTVSGPRALNEILTEFGYDITYREFGDRAHEGFQEHYDDVMRWLDSRPRSVYPRDLLRVPHTAIMPVARRVHWVEADARQALFIARVADAHTIMITTRFARELKVYLHDRLVDLDQPVEVMVNGQSVFSGTVPRSMHTALEQARLLGDERRIYAAELTLTVPETPQALEEMGLGPSFLSDALASRRETGQLSFWEMYAQRAIEERFPSVGFEGREEALPGGAGGIGEMVGIRVLEVVDDTPVARAGLRTGDLLVEFGGEPFFAGNGGVAGLYSWLVRELRGHPVEYELEVWRDGSMTTLRADLQLGPYTVK